jgi:hypothetical protein
MNAAHPCCHLQGSGAAVPVGSAVAPEHQASPQFALAATALLGLSSLTGQTPDSVKAPPPRSPSGASTILRI